MATLGQGLQRPHRVVGTTRRDLAHASRAYFATDTSHPPRPHLRHSCRSTLRITSAILWLNCSAH